jgi:hypothetical protein
VRVESDKTAPGRRTPKFVLEQWAKSLVLSRRTIVAPVTLLSLLLVSSTSDKL